MRVNSEPAVGAHCNEHDDFGLLGSTHSPTPEPKGKWMATIMLMITSVVTAAYWMSYARNPSPFQQDWYLAYEDAFPLADLTVVVLNSLLCVFHLSPCGQRQHALVHLMIAVGGMFFLACFCSSSAGILAILWFCWTFPSVK